LVTLGGWVRRPVASLTLALGAASLASAAEACRMALALGLDVSRSVDAEEYALQRDGVALALLAPSVRAAFLDFEEPVALAVYEWSGRSAHVDILDWTLIVDDAALEAASAQIAATTRSFDGLPTALGDALGYGIRLLRDAPEDCIGLTLDMSGDGRNNRGITPATAYRRNPAGDIVVNGLAITGTEMGVVEYYATEVIQGPGSFVEVANGYDDYRRAIERKLLRELSAFAVGGVGLPASGVAQLPVPDTGQ
jgi:hypothetical protein